MSGDNQQDERVALGIVAGVGLGLALPGVFEAVAALEIAHVNLVVAVFIWVMIYPMMIQIDWSAVKRVGQRPQGLALTLEDVSARHPQASSGQAAALQSLDLRIAPGEQLAVIGPSGAGKSDLVLRLMARGWQLVADDQVMLEGEEVTAPPALRGMLEIRGLGIFEALPVAPRARLCLVVDLAARADVPRLPEPGSG